MAMSALLCVESTRTFAADIVAGTNRFQGEVIVLAPEGFTVDERSAAQFNVSLRESAETLSGSRMAHRALKQTTEAARRGPSADNPHFAVRFAMPIPPENDTNLIGALLGLDANVLAHNHSPGFAVLPNGDVLAIYFSAEGPRGHNERAASARFVQARLRHGAEEWDLPELFFHTRDFNDQSALLWIDGSTVRFFGGGRENPMMFKIAASEDNGAHWKLSLPILEAPPKDFTAQPIVNAFRDPRGSMYFAMDAEDDNSFLWRSSDQGVTWRDMGGRTGGRHSTMALLSDGNTLLSIGGKNTAVNGFTPQNISTNWGATWSESTSTIFSPLGGNQRPHLIRLANGHLCFVTDSYHRRKEELPPGWTHGAGAFVAISRDDGMTWRVKRLPVELPHEADRARGTLGYASVAQAPNGVIHVLATMTHPCLHYEFNEAWVFSDRAEGELDVDGARVEQFAENHANGKQRVSWSAEITKAGSYRLHGKEISYYDNGQKERETTYIRGRKSGIETLWTRDGKKIWVWERDVEKNTAVWTHYWPNGRKRVESHWNLKPRARDAARHFVGLEAHGKATHWSEDGKVSARYEFAHGALVNSSKPGGQGFR